MMGDSSLRRIFLPPFFMPSSSAKNIGLTGANGFIGKTFARLAEAAGHRVIGFSRNPGPGQRSIQEMDLTGLDSMVHLAGETILGLWTAAKKQRIYDSRVHTTERLVKAILARPEPLESLVMASGASCYGNRGDEVLTETSTLGSGFLATVVKDWEKAAFAAEAGTRVTAVRFPMVLGKESGSYPVMARQFKWFLGGPLGNGKQWWPWIHVEDAAGLLLHAVEQAPVSGVINGVAPDTQRNADFTRLLAKSLGRIAPWPAPAFILNRLPGGLGALFLDSTRIETSRGSELGYGFKHTVLAETFKKLAES
jgi:uncharacterized protein